MSGIGLMHQLPLARCFYAGSISVLALTLASCQSVSMLDIQSRLGNLDGEIGSSSYIARAGETLETIAFRYNTSEQALAQLNPEAANGVVPGMPIYLERRAKTVPQVAENSGWIDSQAAAADVQLMPAISPNALPVDTRTKNESSNVTSVTSDQYLIGRAAGDDVKTAYEQTALLDSDSNFEPGQINQAAGYPVEEVIDDENFVLPDAFTTPEAFTSDETNTSPAPFADAWQWPLTGQLARDYDPARPNGRGIEIVGMPGQDVFASRSGVVDWVARSPDGVGKVVIVRHEDDYLSIYSNAQDLLVSMKDTVEQGDPIASLGANASDEPLLRFEISKGGNFLNPMDYLTPK